MSNKSQNVLIYVILAIFSAFILYPIYYTFTSAIMTPEEASAYPPRFWPSSFYLGSIQSVFELVPIGTFLKNSLVVSLIIMLGQLLTSSLAAYAFANMRFFGKRFVFALFMATMMIPWEVTIIPNYLTVKQWGWLDSIQGLTLPFVASAFGTFLLRQFFLQLPRELFEAARIDGCGHLRSFFTLVLPLSRPALATLAVYGFLHSWNMYLWPLLITNSVKMRTVQIGIAMLQFEELTVWNIVLAGATIVLLPSLIVLVLGIKQLVRGLTAGAVKG